MTIIQSATFYYLGASILCAGVIVPHFVLFFFFFLIFHEMKDRIAIWSRVQRRNVESITFPTSRFSVLYFENSLRNTLVKLTY